MQVYAVFQRKLRPFRLTADRLNSWLETAKRWGLRVTDTVRYADKDYALILNKA